MRKSIYFRIFIATALIVLISLSLLGGLFIALSYRSARDENRSMKFSTLRETTTYIAEQSSHHGAQLSDLNISTWLSMTSGVTGFGLLVTDIDGNIVACSENMPDFLGRSTSDCLLDFADSGVNELIFSDMGGLYESDKQVAAVPLLTNGGSQTLGYLFVVSDMNAFRQQWFSFSGGLAVIALGVMVLAFVVSFIAAKKQTEPLNEMANATLRFARGEFEERVQDRGREDEIGQLTRAFNAMAESLENSEMHKRDLIANLSHELKTPMTVIAGFAEGILDGTIPRQDEPKYLGVISSETRRMSRLVRSMLEISTLESSAPSTVFESSFDVAEVVRIALLSLGGKIEKKNLDVRADLPNDELMANGDKDAITQVVYNLIDNAIKFSVDNGILSLCVWQQDFLVHISVTNTGETIPEEDLPHIFNRFHKVDKSRSSDREGAGIGLYLVKQILDNHNVDINVTSKNGVTRVTFSLKMS
ncbi:MAG: HAMP domain-containing histidine kinase [Oscillospiraceae bacterium]|nr:HAMP domain-containing histidine kinase [Oscillospiraceae bacterium]MCL2278427.1 HAMP domain-containing histidine kinase [Oscillospiraceae bacterium]